MELFEQLEKLNKDLKDASKLLGQREARYYVEAYYRIQDSRKQAGSRLHAVEKGDKGYHPREPNKLLEWSFECLNVLERNAAKALDIFSNQYAIGQWLRSHVGIGPVISAGLLAHLDIRGKNTSGSFEKFAGIIPEIVWEKKQKRPYNAELKTLVTFKMGECFVKTCNHKNTYYGRLYKERKILEQTNNEAGKYKAAAEKALSEKNYRKDTDAYRAYIKGKLPDAHIHARARRWAAVMLLRHLHHVMYVEYYEADPPKPYVFVFQDGHTGFLPPPNFPFTPTRGAKKLKDLYDVDDPIKKSR